MPCSVLRAVFVVPIAISVSFMLGAPHHLLAAEQPDQGWLPVEAPGVWQGKPYQGPRSYGWYRAAVHIPAAWQERALQLFLEPLDDARQIFWNGRPIGTNGNLPPTFRSGLGLDQRHPIPNAATLFGGTNILSLRVYRSDGRSGFNVAPPVIFAGDQALRLKGTWQGRLGDDDKWAQAPFADAPFVFNEVEEASPVERSLKQINSDDAPLSPQDALSRFETAPDLKVDLVLSEPHIGQPVSFKFDPRGRLWVVEYLQYPSPAGLKMVSRDVFLRTVYDRIPPAPPNHFKGQDKISIHEDSDGDGSLDRHTVFVEGLNIVSSFALGRGGVWVLNPPYLLFYADRNGDDRPDGEPEVHLEGFGLEDTHAIANSLRWGPDGWLYAAQGSTVSGHIKPPGTNVEPHRSIGQLIWRYHPSSRRYEVFAEGGGNTFGVEIDAHGRIYSGHNGGNTRGFHYVQGGYYLKGFGKHGELSNPYAFGYFNAMAHHDVPRFTHTFIIYEADALPSDYRGKLLGVEPLQGRVVLSEISPDTSSFRTRDVSHPLKSKDPWFRPVDIQLGPDGGVYVADFYEQRIDHASHYQGRVHRESGRIYRLSATNAVAPKPIDLTSLTNTALVELLRSNNKWFRQTALGLLADRADASLSPALTKMLESEKGQTALEALWALHVSAGLTNSTALLGLRHSDPSVRAWTVRLLCDQNQVNDAVFPHLAKLAVLEKSVEVRSQLASSAARLSPSVGLTLLKPLFQHQADGADLHVPLLLWWALESKIDTDRAGVLAFVREPTVWHSPLFQEHIASRLMRRFAASGARQDLLTCVELLQLATGEDQESRLVKGLEQAYAGRPMTGLPKELSEALATVRGLSLVTLVRQGKSESVSKALDVIADDKTELLDRSQLIEALAETHQRTAVEPLLDIVRSSRDDGARKAALSALGYFTRIDIGEQIIDLHNDLPPALREPAQVLVASRPAWSLAFLRAVADGRINREVVPPAIQQKFFLHHRPAIDRIARSQWNQEPDIDLNDEVSRLLEISQAGSGSPYVGKILYGQLCANCHTLFGQGGQVGPDLTPYQRSDTRGLILHIVQPTLEIRTGFENYLIATRDERVLTGFLAEQDAKVVVLRALDGRNVTIPREDIGLLRALPLSLMPEGLLASLTEQQIRDLLAYLRSSQPLPD